MRRDVLGELAHVTMEAETSSVQLAANWRSEDANSMAEARSEGHRARETNGVTLSLKPKLGEPRGAPV